MAKNITYYLGAGASFDSVPTIAKFSEELIKFIEVLKNHHKEELKFVTSPIASMIEGLEYLIKQTDEYGSPDAFAKALHDGSNRGNEMLNEEDIKFLLSLFISYRSHLKTDKRYRLFFTRIGHNIIAAPTVFKCPIDIVSWNYDTQIEKYLVDHLYQEKDILDVIELCTDFSDFGGANILHLNGIAGLFKYIDGKQYHYSETDFKVDFSNLYEDYQNQILSQESISFHWERSNKNSGKKELAIQKLKASNIIVIIGYSFPQENRSFDNQWLENINPRTQVVYCDPAPNELIINRLKGILNESQIIIDKGTNEFYVPDELLT